MFDLKEIEERSRELDHDSIPKLVHYFFDHSNLISSASEERIDIVISKEGEGIGFLDFLIYARMLLGKVWEINQEEHVLLSQEPVLISKSTFQEKTEFSRERLKERLDLDLEYQNFYQIHDAWDLLGLVASSKDRHLLYVWETTA